MTEYSSPTHKQPKYKLFWRKKDRTAANHKTIDISNILPTFEHPCAGQFHSSFATTSTFHESSSDTSFWTNAFDDNDDDDMKSCRHSSLTPSFMSSPSFTISRNALSSIPPPPPPPLVMEPLPDHTSISHDDDDDDDDDGDSEDPEEYAEELQEQELIALAMEMSLRESSSSTSSSSSSPPRSLPVVIISSHDDEDEQWARLEQELLERALQASCTDFMNQSIIDTNRV
ncbi:hypothetical protein FisN_9Lh085 [Fistulifera solaris]|uniref:Uncharacterized protein n=1 Tax=Fistulifera solaris TaxID=1519565 RepID=A0A1Z5KKL6_FISSO|nr:hypothetical protein FisN_9Lh085 [Fistulifera solaris]|eukprot:GAX26816.1 hypothetical protein FisN_9Lh085 [Fistulifera solaris]